MLHSNGAEKISKKYYQRIQVRFFFNEKRINHNPTNRQTVITERYEFGMFAFVFVYELDTLNQCFLFILIFIKSHLIL